LEDPDQLAAIARRQPSQLVFAGKAHPRDEGGKELIARLYGDIQHLRGAIPMAFLPAYDIALARKLVSGADVWLNTPQPPLEASGTSGMKAALNGVPSLERAGRVVGGGLYRRRYRMGHRRRRRRAGNPR
jgi:starch phosphorylase